MTIQVSKYHGIGNERLVRTPMSDDEANAELESRGWTIDEIAAAREHAAETDAARRLEREARILGA